MKRAVLALPFLALALAIAWPATRDRSATAGLCDVMTPARMLEDPGLAHDFAQALRSGDASEVARVKTVFERIRAAHGCDGEVALPTRAPEARPSLPPGHPPVDDRRTPRPPLFEAPATLSI
jgi:hypothetical protein